MENWIQLDWFFLRPEIKDRLLSKFKNVNFSETQQVIIDSFVVPTQIINRIENVVHNYKLVIDFQDKNQCSVEIYKLLKTGKQNA